MDVTLYEFSRRGSVTIVLNLSQVIHNKRLLVFLNKEKINTEAIKMKPLAAPCWGTGKEICEDSTDPNCDPDAPTQVSRLSDASAECCVWPAILLLGRGCVFLSCHVADTARIGAMSTYRREE